jgi:hypothetical protein
VLVSTRAKVTQLKADAWLLLLLAMLLVVVVVVLLLLLLLLLLLCGSCCADQRLPWLQAWATAWLQLLCDMDACVADRVQLVLVMHYELLLLLLLLLVVVVCTCLCTWHSALPVDAAAATAAGAVGCCCCCCCCCLLSQLQLPPCEHIWALVEGLPVKQPGANLEQGTCEATAHSMSQDT